MVKKISAFTNRSERQCEYLRNLCGDDFTYLLLEFFLYNNSKYHCFVPKTIEEVYTVISSLPKSYRVNLKDFYNNIKHG